MNSTDPDQKEIPDCLENFGNLRGRPTLMSNIAPQFEAKRNICPPELVNCRYQFDGLAKNVPQYLYCAPNMDKSGMCKGEINCSLNSSLTQHIMKNGNKVSLPQCPPPAYDLTLKNVNYLRTLPSLLGINQLDKGKKNGCPILRKLNNKFSPLNPDNKHLHQLIFFFIKKKFGLSVILSNNISSAVLIFFNFLIIYICSLNPVSTIYQVKLIIGSITLYIASYFILNKYFELNFNFKK